MRFYKYLFLLCVFLIQTPFMFSKNLAGETYIANVLNRRIENAKQTGVLDLSKLQLKSLDGISKLLGRNCKKIRQINLDNNKIEEIKRDDLNKFRNIKALDLSYNKIKKLNKGCFFSLKKLEKLDLSHNEIQNLPPNIFLKQTKLINLDLSDNLIECLNKAWFRHLRDLEKVNLADNKITRIAPQLFKKNKKLKEIYLGGNKVQMLKAGFGGKDFGKMIKNLRVKEEIFDMW